jgi:glycosyltransferase involved in cell wall biosynthesis
MNPAAARVSNSLKKRILIAHNAYQLRGGEDAVVEAEALLLRQRGHEVLLYERHNADVSARGPTKLMQEALWSTTTTRDLKRLSAEFRPDVIHVHNTLPLISPSIYWAAQRARVPVVQTLHNFRLICPQALLLREGRVCNDCVGRLPWRAAVHRCYRGSALQSAAVASTVQVHRWAGTWNNKVSLYIALNEFCKAKFVEGGLPASRIRIKPNFVDLPAPAAHERKGMLFVGRLSEEKGLRVLANAVQQCLPAIRVRIVGSGPEQDKVDGLPEVEILGPMAPSAVYSQMAQATALVLPSIWYENFPRTLVEAYACGLPVIASRLGAMATLVEEGHTGLLFEPGDARDLARQMMWAESNPHAMQEMGRAARLKYEAELTANANYQMLSAIYAEATTMPP